MIFENMVLLDSFEVNIIDDPYTYLDNLTTPNFIRKNYHRKIIKTI